MDISSDQAGQDFGERQTNSPPENRSPVANAISTNSTNSGSNHIVASNQQNVFGASVVKKTTMEFPTISLTNLLKNSTELSAVDVSTGSAWALPKGVSKADAVAALNRLIEVLKLNGTHQQADIQDPFLPTTSQIKKRFRLLHLPPKVRNQI
jgi:hypothetical protein